MSAWSLFIFHFNINLAPNPNQFKFEFNFRSILNFRRSGIVFIINGGFYACTAPVWGFMVDKFLHPKISALIGSMLIATAFCLIGPVSLLPIST